MSDRPDSAADLDAPFGAFDGAIEPTGLAPHHPGRLHRLAAICWTLAILVACWTPSNRIPHGKDLPRTFDLPNLDKGIHFVMFGGFGYLWLLADRRRRVGRVMAAGLALAAITELGQEIEMLGREAGLMDGLADALGLSAGCAVALWRSGRLPVPAAVET